MADPFWVILRHTTDLWGCGSAIYLRRGTYLLILLLVVIIILVTMVKKDGQY